MKKPIVRLLLVAALAATPITSYAVDKRITASDVGTYETTSGVYAKGFTTSTSRHYTSVNLYYMQTGTVAQASGRKWGTGKVSAQTPVEPDTTLGRLFKYNCRVFYGF